MKYFLTLLLISYAFAEEVIEDKIVQNDEIIEEKIVQHDDEVIEDKIEVDPAYYNPMMGMGGMMNPIMDPMMQMQMGMGGMNMMDPMMQMGMNPMNQMGGGMYDPMMMQQMMLMGMGGMNPMMNGMYDPMHQMFSGKVDEEPKVDAENAQFMMMPMGGACGSTCSCMQRCKMMWWMPCSCPPCNGCGCCNDNPQVTPEEPTTTTTSTTTTEAPTTCRPCTPCNGCSCSPCTVWWMCAPRCPSTCCNGGNNNNCCNSPPAPSPPSGCCSCPTCVPWMPCKPCKCISNCCPGQNCCSGSGCQDPDANVPTIPPVDPQPVPINPDFDNRIPINPDLDNRIPIDPTDPWNSLPPRNPRDPLYIPREPVHRPDPRDRRDPIYRPSIRDDYWDDDFDFDFRRPVRRERDFDRIYYPPSRDVRRDDDWDLKRDPREAEFFPSPRDEMRDPNFRMPVFDDQPPVRSPRT